MAAEILGVKLNKAEIEQSQVSNNNASLLCSHILHGLFALGFSSVRLLPSLCQEIITFIIDW